MSLPLSRNTTYAPGSQIKSADLNDIQDKIISGNLGPTGNFAIPGQLNVTGNVLCNDAQSNQVHTNACSVSGPITATSTVNAPDYKFSTPRRRWDRRALPDSSGDWVAALAGGAAEPKWVLATTGVHALLFAPSFEAGERIVLWKIEYSNASASVTAAVQMRKRSGATYNLMTSLTLAAATGGSVFATSGVLAIDIAADEDIVVSIAPNAGFAASELQVIRMAYDVIRP